MKQVFNPYLPSWEYVPDGEPHIFNNRLYIFGSHDHFNGSTYCMEPYVCWSAPTDDLSDWTYHGVIYTGKEDVLNDTGSRLIFAPDVVESDGKYYLYYGLDTSNTISVAVSDKPEGPYYFYGNVHHKDGQILGLKDGDVQQFDPGVFKDDDGTVYLYSGFSSTPEVFERIRKKTGENISLRISTEGNWVMQLDQDMLTLKNKPKNLLPGVSNSAGTGFEGHEFFEASSMRKFKNRYYAVYSSIAGHELCYAMSEYPDREFVYKGVLHSNGNIGISDTPCYYYANNHGSIIEINGDYYVFGHRHTNYTQYQRQGIAERLHMNADGSFHQAEMTSYGLHGKPLKGQGEYPAYIACVLKSMQGACKADTSIDHTLHPAITQDENRTAYITNIRNGAVIGFKYFEMKDTHAIGAFVKSTDACALIVKTSLNGMDIAVIQIQPCKEWTYFTAAAQVTNGVESLYFIHSGTGALCLQSIRID